jgi:hypothetical protein
MNVAESIVIHVSCHKYVKYILKNKNKNKKYLKKQLPYLVESLFPEKQWGQQACEEKEEERAQVG